MRFLRFGVYTKEHLNFLADDSTDSYEIFFNLPEKDAVKMFDLRLISPRPVGTKISFRGCYVSKKTVNQMEVYEDYGYKEPSYITEIYFHPTDNGQISFKTEEGVEAVVQWAKTFGGQYVITDLEGFHALYNPSEISFKEILSPEQIKEATEELERIQEMRDGRWGTQAKTVTEPKAEAIRNFLKMGLGEKSGITD